MFRGMQEGSVDVKFRLKFPALVRKRLLEHYDGGDLFITSLDRRDIKIYPLAEWAKVEARLADRSGADGISGQVKNKVQFLANQNGVEQTLDAQGRVLVPGRLREALGHSSKLMMQWQGNHIVAVNEALYEQLAIENRLTDAERGDAANLGM